MNCNNKRKLDYEIVEKEFRERGYILISKEYKNSSEKLEYICPDHPKEINTINYNNFKNGSGCFHCFGKKKYTMEEARSIFKDAGYELLEHEYLNNNTKMRFKCPKHPTERTFITLKSVMKAVAAGSVI